MIRYEHLLGLSFEYGRQDCYELLRRFYRDNFSIELRNYARPPDFWRAGLDLYMAHFKAEGFQLVDVEMRDLRVGDVLLTAVVSDTANHCGIYVGDNRILHHFIGRFSEVTPIKGIWRNQLCAVARHSQLPDLTRETVEVDLIDLLSPRMKERLHEKAAELLPSRRS